jgi:radical SAM superfamily enzyme YgiQ (UPF0313 family)
LNADRFDVVFLHPGGKNLKGLQGPIIPIGMIGLASYLEQNGYKVHIYNLLLEKALNEKLTDEMVLRQIRTNIYCIDLHWFVHAYETISLAELIRIIHPDALIVIGGLTASYFAEEIIKEFSCIDVVIKGDAEEPLRCLAERVKSDERSFSQIPNITYRVGNEVMHKEVSYQINQKLLDNIDFLDFKLVHHWQESFYLCNIDYQFNRKSTNVANDYYLAEKGKSWPLYTGRGCNFNCSFCGGSRNAFKRCFNREMLILRSPERVAQDIIRLDSLGIERIYIPHSPLIINTDYHQKILDILERSGKTLNCGFLFEDFPFFFNEEINRKYAEIFDNDKSLYTIYIGNINERVARLNKCYVSLEIVTQIQKFGRIHRVPVMTCFTLGMPGEDYLSTMQQAVYIKKCIEYKEKIALYKAEMHPASNIFAEPDQFNITTFIKNFKDYYIFLKTKMDKSMLYGYALPSKLSPDDQFEIINSVIKTTNTKRWSKGKNESTA